MPKASATHATARFQRPAKVGRAKKRTVMFGLLHAKREERLKKALAKKPAKAASAPKLVATTPLAEEHALFVEAAKAAREEHVAAGRTVIAWNEDGEPIGVYGAGGEILPLPEGVAARQLEVSA